MMAIGEDCGSTEEDRSAQAAGVCEFHQPPTRGLGPWQIVVWLALGLAIVVPLTALVSDSLFRTVFGIVVWSGVIIVAISVSCLSVLSVASRYHGAARQIVVWQAVGMGIVVGMAANMSNDRFRAVVWVLAIVGIAGPHLAGALRYHGARRRIELVVRAIGSIGMLTAIALISTLSPPMFMLLFGMSMALDIVKDIVVERWYPETTKE
jgi:hypothetical protein